MFILKATEFDKQGAAFRKRFTNEQSLVAAGWIVQPKFDGCMGIVEYCAGLATMVTRTGEPVLSADHIVTGVLHALKAESIENVAIIGELWSESLKFPDISGLVRRREPAPALRFVVHDIVNIIGGDPYASLLPYRHRMTIIKRMFPPVTSMPHGGGVVYATTSTTVDAEPTLDVFQYALLLKSLGGYDGAMLKDPNATYIGGKLSKAGELVKVKPTATLDLRVVDTRLEIGEKTGRKVLTLAVDYRGVRTWVGSGVPHTMRPSDVLGKIVEIQFMALTEDGFLREPRFVAVRFDKEQVDE